MSTPRQEIGSLQLVSLYRDAHNLMRNMDGLQPQEAFDELLKYLFFKETNEQHGPSVRVRFQLTSAGAPSYVDEKATHLIRGLFHEYLTMKDAWAAHLWRDKQIHLSDSALTALHQLFQDLEFNQISFDIRSAAIKEFIPAEIRRGLGIYLTPDNVVRMMVEVTAPQQATRVYDPACGSGTFLIEVLKSWKEASEKKAVYGTDKNPRMLLLADLNMGHLSHSIFHRYLTDALFQQNHTEEIPAWLSADSFDLILTNPPFGVVLDNRAYDLSNFKSCKTSTGSTLNKQLSEIVFIEKCLEYLKPGGILGIVLPRSVATNPSLKQARAAFGELGYVYAVVALPPETFYSMGTQITAVVLFVKKYNQGEDRSKKVKIVLASVSNVGYDSTGRSIEGNELSSLSKDITKSLAARTDSGICVSSLPVAKALTFSYLPDLLAGKTKRVSGRRLGEVITMARTGKTPSRAAYSDQGLFLVKVGNLTGRGISWVPRDRNFISEEARSQTLMLQEGDILLTSSAHSVVYIGKKVDIVTQIPASVGGAASFVGEVMLLRPKQELIDPFRLLAFLRFPATTERLQRRVRGQTAHLHADDLLDMSIPDEIFESSNAMEMLMQNLRKEAALNDEINNVIYQQEQLLRAL